MDMLVQQSKLPVVAEGRYRTPDEVARAFELGAHAVVVGSAITRPQLITRHLVQAVPVQVCRPGI
jgi:N-acylglucosamine-6-phosphate 2-epimerase